MQGALPPMTTHPTVYLLGIPWDAHSSYMQGPALAPPEIRRAFDCDSANKWTESGIDLGQAGVRCMTGHQKRQAEKSSVEVHEMKDWQGPPALTFDGPLYISVDMDVLDPTFAPGVSHWEPGGLSVREILQVLQQVKADRIVGADLVEYNPRQDPSGRTAMVAAKLMKELMGRMLV